jgi:hypothetical protein
MIQLRHGTEYGLSSTLAVFDDLVDAEAFAATIENNAKDRGKWFGWWKYERVEVNPTDSARVTERLFPR